jgi:MFS family permease
MKYTMTSKECRATVVLAMIFMFRLLGLFMILPVFSPYAHQLRGSTPLLIGIALGAYGLTQAVLQIPFGMLSDRIGRKIVITVGLLLFALGSIMGALSTSITTTIVARALQGMGAVGSVIIAMAADVTREQVRSQAMALIGLMIGLSFAVSLVLGPALNDYIHVPGIFWVTCGLAGLGIVILHVGMPATTAHVPVGTQTAPQQLLRVLKHKELLQLDMGILILHAILTASFVAIPLLLVENPALHSTRQWLFYLPILSLSFILMIPLLIAAEKYQQHQRVFLLSIGCVLASQLLLTVKHDSLFILGLWLTCFFTGFNVLEASLPSLIAKTAPADSKGTAMGVYSSMQFLGIFLGGSIGGWLYTQHHPTRVFLYTALLAALWLLLAVRLPITSVKPIQHVVE